MNIKELARKYKISPSNVYRILYEMEAIRGLEVKRDNAGKIKWQQTIFEALDKELKERGYPKEK